MPANVKDSGYNKGFFIRCPTCLMDSRLPKQIRDSDIPAVLICQQCGTHWNWASVPILPKLPPNASAMDWVMYTHSEAEIAAARDPNELNTVEPESKTVEQLEADSGKGVEIFATEVPEAAEQKPTPFYRTARYMGKNTRILFGVIARLHEQIEHFADTVLAFFDDKSKWSSRLAHGYKKQYMQEFLTNPYVALPCPCDDDTAAQYSRWVIAPKFFSPGFGFVTTTGGGGCRLEVVNSYSRYYFPVENFAEEMGLPPRLDIKVAGNKLIGGSVQVAWKDIPGVATDHDHTDAVASVYMKEPHLARIWLAQHGVRPWAMRRIELGELSTIDVDDNIKSNPLFDYTFARFIKTGRLGVFWQDTMAARRFAALSCYMLKGLTVVFTTNQQTRAAWDTLYSNFAPKFNRGNQLVFFKNGDPVRWDAVQQVKSVIVDMNTYAQPGEKAEQERLDPTVMENLLRYGGRLILLCSDPLQDFDEENSWAAYVHALAGYGVFDKVLTPEWKGRGIVDKRVRKLMGELLAR